jgi:hypothetical protein
VNSRIESSLKQSSLKNQRWFNTLKNFINSLFPMIIAQKSISIGKHTSEMNQN